MRRQYETAHLDEDAADSLSDSDGESKRLSMYDDMDIPFGGDSEEEEEEENHKGFRLTLSGLPSTCTENNITAKLLDRDDALYGVMGTETAKTGKISIFFYEGAAAKMYEANLDGCSVDGNVFHAIASDDCENEANDENIAALHAHIQASLNST